MKRFLFLLLVAFTSATFFDTKSGGWQGASSYRDYGAFYINPTSYASKIGARTNSLWVVAFKDGELTVK